MGNQRERGEAMGFKKKSGLLVGAGFLLGTVGVKAPVSYTHLTLPTILLV